MKKTFIYAGGVVVVIAIIVIVLISKAAAKKDLSTLYAEAERFVRNTCYNYR